MEDATTVEDERRKKIRIRIKNRNLAEVRPVRPRDARGIYYLYSFHSLFTSDNGDDDRSMLLQATSDDEQNAAK